MCKDRSPGPRCRARPSGEVSVGCFISLMACTVAATASTTGCSQRVAEAGKHTYTDLLQTTTERLACLPSLHPAYITTPKLEKLGNEDLVQVPCNHGVTAQKYINMDD